MAVAPGRQTLVLATAGTAASAGAVRYADWLSAAYGVRVEVVAVHATPPRTSETAATEARIDGLLQIELGRSPAWPVILAHGDCATALAHAAAARGAALIVLGATNARDRAAPLAERLASACDTPVLSVPNTLGMRPRRAICAVDFSQSSLRSAALALDVIDRPAEVLLIRADETSGSTPGPPMHVQLLLDAVEDSLRRSPGVTFAKLVLRGDPAEAIVTYAVGHGVDLIAVGRRRRADGSSRAGDIGRVARQVVRSADCAILVGGVVEHVPLSSARAPFS